MRNVSKVLLTAGLIAASAAVMAQPQPYTANNQANNSYFGPYIGVQGGWAYANEGPGLSDAADYIYDHYSWWSEKKVRRGGAGVRAYVGWAFNRYLGVEGGYSAYPDNKYHADNGYDYLDERVETESWDIMARFTLPLEKSFGSDLEGYSVFAKVGGVYINSRIKGEPYRLSNSGWRPGFGFGAAYNLNKNIAIDIAYMYAFGKDKIDAYKWEAKVKGSHFLPSTSMLTFGISYTLTDL